MSFHHITVRKEGRKYVLYNNGNICGDRLYKGGAFPFLQDGWNTHSTKKEADVAAERLQKYLDLQEGAKRPKKKSDVR